MTIKMPLLPTMFVAVMALSAMASAETVPKVESNNIKWSASTGLGYDTNAYQSPDFSYVDYAAIPLGSNPTVTPQMKSGLFVPYEISMDMAKNRDQNAQLLVSGNIDGSLYLGGGLSNANKFNLGLSGGFEYVLDRQGKSEDTLYVGALFESHKRVYVDHDSGLEKATSTLKDISTLYNYNSMGVEAKYKHRVGIIDWRLKGKYALNDYDNPVGAPQQDHTYFTVGADASIPVVSKTRLNLSYDHAVRDYANRHARNVLDAAFSTVILAYSYNTFGATLRNRISKDWLMYLDFDHSRRSDNHQGYGDYKNNRYGARMLYEQGRLKARLSLHHWLRDYPNGFAFDVAGQGAKTYSGNNLKLKAELEQTGNTTLWTELDYKAQSATDLRYDYVRTQIMAGMSWAY